MKFQRILIGIDDSKYAENATQQGFDLARQFNAKVALVHIVEPVVTAPMNDTSMMGTFIPTLNVGVEDMQIENIQEQYASKLMSNTIARYGEGLEITQFNEYGSAEEAIINCASQFSADLIVVGTHSRNGLDRLLMGNVAEYVVRHSPVAVLVVPLSEKENTGEA